MYAVRVARCDGKHLTADDYQWIRERLGMVADDQAHGDAA